MRTSTRRLLVMVAACLALLTASCGTTQAAPEAGVVPLVDLSGADAVAAWTTVNDPVMGGRSTSAVTFGDGLVFAGSLSLENNGGFASARSPQDPGIGRRATAATSLRVRAVGDGKTYLLRVGAAGQRWSYVQRFATEAGVDRDYDLPVGAFQAVGMRLDPAPDVPQTLDPSGITQISVYILDKQQGPFTITIRAIDAVSQVR